MPKSQARNGHEQHEPLPGHKLARLVYLLSQFKVQIHPQMARMLPAGEWLSKVYLGPGASGFTSDGMLKRFQELYDKGKGLGEGSYEEAMTLIAEMLNQALRTRDDLTVDQLRKVWHQMDELWSQEDLMLGPQVADISLRGESVVKKIPKWNTGLEPLDSILGGFYQGIFIFMGKPGTGKTSILFTLAEEVVKHKAASSVVIFENELPENMAVGRFAPLRKRTKFREQDRLIVASWGAEEIIEWVEHHPDKDRLVIYDSPDVLTKSAEEMRFYLMNQYRNLVILKQLCKAVFVSSQLRRKDTHSDPTMESVAEAWSKAWYADGIIGLTKDGANELRFHINKNRFGPPGGQQSISYNYEDLSWGIHHGQPGDKDDVDW